MLPVQIADALASLVTASPALLLAVVGWWLQRRDDKARIASLTEENTKLLESMVRMAERLPPGELHRLRTEEAGQPELHPQGGAPR
jgi:hypothetical protein